MNPRYRETFDRNRLLFVLPLALGAVIGLTFGLGSPKLYRSDASLGIRSLDTASSQFGTPPAAQNQSMLNELLATRSFADTVAARSPLQTYLKTHAETGWSPTSLLKRALKGAPSLDNRIASALSPKRVKSTLPGPDVLAISFEAPDPALARATLKVLISQFFIWRTQLQGNALTAATHQFDLASKKLVQARNDLNAYNNQHPSSTTSADPVLRALVNSQIQAVHGLQAATNVMNTAAAAASGGTGLPAIVHVIAKPTYPVGPTTGKKRVVELGFVGAFVGALISFLAIMYLSREGSAGSGPTARPVPLRDPSPNGGLSEQERSKEILGGETKNPFLARRE